jgi:hypothetical protein
MVEVGLPPFARIALLVSKAVLSRYRRRFSKAAIQPAAVVGDPLPDTSTGPFRKRRCDWASIANCAKRWGWA